MTLTRHQIVQNSRQLRSGRLTTNASQAFCILKPSSLPTQSLARGTKTRASREPMQSKAHAEIFRDSVPRSVAMTDIGRDGGHANHGFDEAGSCLTPRGYFASLIQKEDLDRDHDSRMPLGASAPPTAILLPSVPATPHRSSEVAEGSIPSTEIQAPEIQGHAADSLLSPEDVGLPSDGVWDHDAAYDRKFCYDHGEFEFLLGTADRWMFSGDFDVRSAEAALEALHQQYQESSPRFDPHVRCCQAECQGSLFSHVYQVVEKRRHGDVMLYLVRWKACWTPESSIDDKGWLEASLEVNRDPRRRRTTRLGNSPEEEMAKYEKIMMVVKLDDRGS